MKYVKLFEEFIAESISSDHFTDRVVERIQALKIDSIDGYTGDKKVAKERCKKVLLKKVELLKAKSYVGDSIYKIENFGKIILKDSNGTYSPNFSTDDGVYKGKMFVAIVFNNLIITTYLVHDNLSVREIKFAVEAHTNRKHPEYAKKYRDVSHDWLDGEETIIDMDLSDEEFEKILNPPTPESLVPKIKQNKEMAISLGDELIFIGKLNDKEVYKKKTIERIEVLNTKTMRIEFTDRAVKTFVIDGDKLQKKFVVSPTNKDKNYYIGDLIELGKVRGRYHIIISVSQTLDHLDIS